LTRSPDDILKRLDAELPTPLPKRIGVAVSGGSDSVALLHLLHQRLSQNRVEICVVTVDHGLRAASAAEARQVTDLAKGLGLSHDILLWQEGPGGGSLQDAARQARYALMADWARANDIAWLALGHTADDQAETVLMRLMRASGVDGLSAMSAQRDFNGVTLWRPLLWVRRADLRAYLSSAGVTWIEDPSNEDVRFERVRVRQTLAQLQDLGLTVDALTTVAANMAQARQALDHTTQAAAVDLAEVRAGAIAIDRVGFAALPDEIAYRLLVAAIKWTTSKGYPPRRAPMLAAIAGLRKGVGSTLGGVRLLCHQGRIWICRESRAVADCHAAPDGIWDGRWRILCKETRDCEVRALGEDGLRHCTDWRATGLPAPVLVVTPALWKGAELIAAPLAGHADGCRAELVRGEEEFHASFLSH
jgi:tRNA(Ile)-lysidine synthase